MGWGMLGKIGGGLKGLGKGIVKGVDKFDDMIKLKEIANVMQFVPGPQQAFFKPLAMTYAGFDTAKGLKNKNLGQALKGGLQMYGSSKIDTGGMGSWGGLKEGFQGPTRGFRNALQDNITGNIKNYTGGMANPLNLSGNNKSLYDTVGAPLVNQAMGGQQQQQQQQQGPLVQASMQRYRPQMAQGGIANADYYSPGSAIVGEAGPEFLTSLNGPQDERAAAGILGLPPMRGGGMIPHLPPDYSGWVNGPHIATLGENGTEAVLPLDKLRTAAGGAITYPMMQGGSISGIAGSLGSGARALGGGAMKLLGWPAAIAEGLGFNPLGALFGGDIVSQKTGGETGAGALFGEGTPYPDYESYKASQTYIEDEAKRKAEWGDEQQPIVIPGPRTDPGHYGLEDQIPLPEGFDDYELEEMAGEQPISEEIDPALLDNPNARYWKENDPDRYASILRGLREQQTAGAEFPVPESPFEMPIETPSPLAGLEDINLPQGPLTNAQHWLNQDPARWRDMLSQSISPVNNMMQPPSPQPAQIDPSMFGGVPQDPEAERIQQAFSMADAGAFQNPRLYPELYPEEYERSVGQDQGNAAFLRQMLTGEQIQPGPLNGLTREQQLQLARLYRE